jgi:hypothetical protein
MKPATNSQRMDYRYNKRVAFCLLQMAPLLFILCLLLCYASFRFRRRRMEALAAKLSGPPAWPLVGNALQLLGSTHGKGRIHFLRYPVSISFYPLLRAFCLSHAAFLPCPTDVLAAISRVLHRYQTPTAFWLGPRLYVAVARPADIEVRRCLCYICLSALAATSCLLSVPRLC